MRKLILILLALMAAAYGGVKGYIWYQTKQQLEQLTVSLASMAKLSYGGISSSILNSGMQGWISVNDISIQPTGSPDAVQLGAFKLRLGSVLDFLWASQGFKEGQLPLQGGITLEHLNLNMDSGLMSQLMASSKPQQSLGWPIFMICGQESPLAELKAMGYRSLTTDINLHYQFDQPSQSLLLDIGFHTNNMYALSLKFSIYLGVSDLKMSSLAFVMPKLGKTSVVYMDDSYLERKLRYCSAQKKMEPEAYLKSYITAFDSTMRSQGVALPAATLKDYMDFLAAPNNLYLGIAPSEPIDLTKVSLYSPRQLLDWLAPSIAFNDQPLAELKVQWLNNAGSTASQLPSFPKPTPAHTSEAATGTSESLVDAPLDPKVKVDKNGKMVLLEDLPTRVTVAAYKPVAPAKLASYLNRPVKLKVVTGKSFEGRIKSITGNRVLLEQPIQKGAATFELYLNQITEAEVYY
jgi:hypothetical protein